LLQTAVIQWHFSKPTPDSMKETFSTKERYHPLSLV